MIGSGEAIVIALVVLLFFGDEALQKLTRAYAEAIKEVKKAKLEVQQAIEREKAELLDLERGRR